MENPIDDIKRRREQEKRAFKAGIGQVGIFWFFKGKLVQDSISFTCGEDYGDFVNGRNDHVTFWQNVQRLLPEAAEYEYDEVPRGRVVYSKRTRTFYVYGSKAFVNSTKKRSIVVSGFTLSSCKVVFRSDEHYELPS